MPFIPHTEHDIEEMLATIGVSKLNQLFDEIPDSLRVQDLPEVPVSLTEMELARLMRQRAALDGGMMCFIGAGAYEHHIPAAVWEIASRGEYLTAYTPYQAEASQGTLQLLYEFQTMMASLMGLDVSNASLYEGGSSVAEAILMAARSHRKHKTYRVLIPRSLHPYYRDVIETIVGQHDIIQLIDVPYDSVTGLTKLSAIENDLNSEEITAVVIPQPNFFGLLEDVDAMTDWAHERGAIVIGVVNPMAMALLKPPGQWGKKGADIACGEGQPLGVPLASGGPYYGFLCCKKDFVRQLPGRIVGRTVDKEGKQGFVLTLQAREQHIRRAKATSNICTNQGLLVTASTIYMSLLGPEGLRQVAEACYLNTMSLKKKLAAIDGVELVFKGHHFHELVLRLDKSVDGILKILANQKLQAGFSLTSVYPELGECLLICVTETKTEEDIEWFVQCIAQVLLMAEDGKTSTSTLKSIECAK
jgi:glycine dehydrogenase subunit 1